MPEPTSPLWWPQGQAELFLPRGDREGQSQDWARQPEAAEQGVHSTAPSALWWRL